ncbi:GNAT family N-acetyltransferase [Pseudoalteromonas denitrificans]|uniref:Ribosomal protein S18 acetylase RimI n=1 Tax=Pseudoalteromonas denitrificans DSM 6059 TaxID=1123010 RepID=A0A1I1NB54_9GAMM|nr:GNAT family N-acetyltransferase [Pseudoalteromonas denitrificans]SFC94596.1 Ribosomal protein S18 acetylase RimI [Pseudoalteromonas denitrificans DSM 6059]
MVNIHLRAASIQDLAILLEFEQNVIAAERPFNDAIKLTPTSYYDLNELIQDDKSNLLVVESKGDIIGSGYAQIRSSKISLKHEQHAYLGFMYVDSQHRGLGINKLIMDSLIQWSKAQGITDLYLDVYEGNDAAIRAYEKVGFSKSLVEMKLSLNN